MASKKINLPSVLAFSRSISPGHVLMFSASSKSLGQCVPIVVRNEPTRGLNATAKSKEKKMQAVPQVLESANLLGGHDTLVLKGKLLVRNNMEQAHSCNDKDFPMQHLAVVEQAKKAGVFPELARRYATNLLAGLWGWRNTAESEDVAVHVSWKKGGKEESVFCENLILDPQDPFGKLSPDHEAAVQNLADAFTADLTSQGRGTIYRVTAHLRMGETARVYPSQEWASESFKAESVREWPGGKGVTRVLAKVRNGNGELQAIINDRKAGNALRVIDTWYVGDDDATSKPIAVEVYGANSHQSVAHREKNDFFSILEKVVGGTGMTPNDLRFYIAMCIRGGVLGGKDDS